MENNKNLILRTLNRTSDSLRESKAFQKIAAFVLVCVTALSLGSCSFLNQFISVPPVSGGTGTSGTDQTQGNGYSDLLNSLLKDSAANTLINRAKEDPSLRFTAEFDPHPYAFLEKQGHDVKAIKNGKLKCTTQTFVKYSEPNNLYMLTYVRNNATTPYYTEYLLKYELTEKEMQDYKMLHEDLYPQTFLINNTISKLKPATIISKTNITVEAHNGIRKVMTETLKEDLTQFIDTEYADIMLKSYNTENNTFEIYVFTAGTSSVAKSESKVGVYKLRAGAGYIVKVQDGVFTSPNRAHDIRVQNDFDISNEPVDSVTTYHTQSIGFDMSYVDKLNCVD